MKKQDKDEVKLKVTKFYFWNRGKSFTLCVTTPEDVPEYRLRELFYQNFVGKGKELTFDPMVFSKFKGTYTVS